MQKGYGNRIQCSLQPGFFPQYKKTKGEERRKERDSPGNNEVLSILTRFVFFCNHIYLLGLVLIFTDHVNTLDRFIESHTTKITTSSNPRLKSAYYEFS